MDSSLSNQGSGLIRNVVEFNRPANVTPYVAGAAVSSSTTAPTVIMFPSAARLAGGDGLILGVRHTKGGATAQNYRLDLFSDEVTPPNDGTVFPLLAARRELRVARIDLIHTVGPAGSDCTEALSMERSIPFACKAFSTALWGVLVAPTGFTPASAVLHRIEVLTLPLN